MKYDGTSNLDSRQGFPAVEEKQRNSTMFVIHLEVDHIGSKNKIFNKWLSKFPRLIAYANEVFPCPFYSVFIITILLQGRTPRSVRSGVEIWGKTNKLPELPKSGDTTMTLNILQFQMSLFISRLRSAA